MEHVSIILLVGWNINFGNVLNWSNETYTGGRGEEDEKQGPG